MHTVFTIKSVRLWNQQTPRKIQFFFVNVKQTNEWRWIETSKRNKTKKKIEKKPTLPKKLLNLFDILISNRCSRVHFDRMTMLCFCHGRIDRTPFATAAVNWNIRSCCRMGNPPILFCFGRNTFSVSHSKRNPNTSNLSRVWPTRLWLHRWHCPTMGKHVKPIKSSLKFIEIVSNDLIDQQRGCDNQADFHFDNLRGASNQSQHSGRSHAFLGNDVVSDWGFAMDFHVRPNRIE